MNNADNPIGWQHATPSKGKENEIFEWNNPGLTKREYFAGLAMQGLMANDSSCSISHIIEMSIKAADKLLKQLETK